MDINAHLKVEMVLNEGDENEEEKRFNEIICYDSGDSDDGDSSNVNEQSDTSALLNGEDVTERSPQSQQNLNDAYREEMLKNEKKSNAEQMRKYRAKQRSDPLRYQQYLERERMRNYKRKYEKRIQAAQEEAQALGIPYIVLEPKYSRRGRKPIFGDVSLVLPSKYDGDIEDDSNSFNSDDMPMIPVECELLESDDIYQEPKPNISVVNINKLLSQPRSALQTLLPQEVNERERVSNFIKLEHDYVKQKTESTKEKFSMLDGKIRRRSGKGKTTDKFELMQLQEQCRSFILKQSVAASLENPKRKRQPNKIHAKRKPSSMYVRSNVVEHEDLDDLFKELAEVANKEPPKKKHSSPHKKSPRQRSPRKHSHRPHENSPRRQSFFKPMRAEDDGNFSLTVSMPVQPIVSSTFESIDLKSEPKSPTADPRYRNDDLETLKESVKIAGDVYICNEDSIEIKQEPIYSDDDFC